MEGVLLVKGVCFIPRYSFKWFFSLDTKKQMLHDLPPDVLVCLFRPFPVLLNLSTFSFFICWRGNTHIVHDQGSFISFVSGENVPGWKVTESFSLWAFLPLLSWGIILCNIDFFHVFPQLPEKDAKWKGNIDSLSSVGHRLFQKTSVRKTCVCVWVWCFLRNKSTLDRPRKQNQME